MRQCGGCTLCCKLVPVVDGGAVNGMMLPGSMNKPAGQRCPMQSLKGCRVHGTSRMPRCCTVWNCLWLANADTADLSRPDRSHYVIDALPDYVTALHHETGERYTIPVVQVWVDPKHPDAHRDPALRRYVERRGKEGVAAIIRYSSADAFVLVPPSMASDGQWHEQRGQSEGEHSVADVASRLRELSRPRGEPAR